MPFGIRYTAREMFRGLQVKFQGESEDSLAKVVLHMIYYRYLQPAVVSVFPLKHLIPPELAVVNS